MGSGVVVLWVLVNGFLGWLSFRQLGGMLTDIGLISEANVGVWQRTLRWQRSVSLGLDRVVPFKLGFDLMDQAGLVLGEMTQVKTLFEPLVGQFMRGEETELDLWEEVLVRASEGADEVVVLGEMVKRVSEMRVVEWWGKGEFLEESGIKLIEVAGLLKELEGLESHLPTMLGFEKKQHYVVLLQNNYELWPTGGYMGSFAEVWVENGALFELKVEDIGVPNGQIKGYVEAPWPISKYTHQGGTPGWRLRESNWDPDLTRAFGTIEWFFNEGGVDEIDGMIGITLFPVMETVEKLGPIHLIDYDLEITGENFYQETQREVEMGFFDGSTQKREFLGDLAKQLLWQIEHEPDTSLAALGPIVFRNLERKQITAAFKDEGVADWFKRLKWDGSLWPVACVGDDCVADYIHVNEANLGINKTNCCVERQFTQTIEVDTDKVQHTLELFYKNNNPHTPNPPYQWGGGYQAWTRVHVPSGAGLISIEREGVPLEMDIYEVMEVEGKTVIGFPVLVGGGQEFTYRLKYHLPILRDEFDRYELAIQKQSGVESIPWTVHFISPKRQEERQMDLFEDMVVSFLK
jgi:hypothetical protein